MRQHQTKARAADGPVRARIPPRPGRRSRTSNRPARIQPPYARASERRRREREAAGVPPAPTRGTTDGADPPRRERPRRETRLAFAAAGEPRGSAAWRRARSAGASPPSATRRRRPRRRTRRGRGVHAHAAGSARDTRLCRRNPSSRTRSSDAWARDGTLARPSASRRGRGVGGGEGGEGRGRGRGREPASGRLPASGRDRDRRPGRRRRTLLLDLPTACSASDGRCASATRSTRGRRAGALGRRVRAARAAAAARRRREGIGRDGGGGRMRRRRDDAEFVLGGSARDPPPWPDRSGGVRQHACLRVMTWNLKNNDPDPAARFANQPGANERGERWHWHVRCPMSRDPCEGRAARAVPPGGPPGAWRPS